jgi:hypothetical protein
MGEKAIKYCSLCGMPDPDQYWCKYCRSSYKKVRRQAKTMPFASDTELKITPMMVEYLYKEGLQYIWSAKWYNRDGTLIYMSQIEDITENHPESVKDMKEYTITKYYITPPS